LLASAQVMAQETEDVLVRVNAPLTVREGESVGTAVAVNHGATINGQVREGLLVINGDAEVVGSVGGETTVVNGKLLLRSTAVVNRIVTINGTVVQDPGAVVRGPVEHRSSVEAGSPFRVFSFFFWFGMSVLMLAVGLLLLMLGGKQVGALSGTLQREPWRALGAGLLAWLLLPLAAAALIFTLVGIPISIAILAFVLPALWFVGHLLSAYVLGGILVERGLKKSVQPGWALLAGLVALQVLGWVPGVGGLVVLCAALFGSGALVLVGWRRTFSSMAARRQQPVPMPLAGSA